MSAVGTICLIDDDQIYQVTTKRQIEQRHLADRILLFSDGEEAIEFFRNASRLPVEKIPDVIFLDINMPVMDGWDFLEEFAKIKTELGKKVIIFMVSSSVNEADIERARSFSDITDFIIKPVNYTKLTELFETYKPEN